VPWKDMHQALIDAQLKQRYFTRTYAFVLQTSLDDFYVSYQINAYVKRNKQAVIYSNLHQNIQDVCNERGIEIMSPHYARDGNKITIPENYIDKEYQAPSFSVNLKE
jgi:small-conductance mechanosensitive channel